MKNYDDIDLLLFIGAKTDYDKDLDTNIANHNAVTDSLKHALTCKQNRHQAKLLLMVRLCNQYMFQ